MSSQSYQCLFLTILNLNNELLTMQDFAHLRSALGPHTHSSHTRRVFLERKLIARSRRSVLSRFFGEWKYYDIPALVDSDTSDFEPEQADSSDDESTNLESDDDVPNGWDPHHYWNFLKQSYRNYDDVPDEFESDDDEPDELESGRRTRRVGVRHRRQIAGTAWRYGLSAKEIAVVLHLLSRTHGV